MIEKLMIICAFIAGALIYYALQDDIEEHLFKIKKNMLVPVFLILLVFGGIYMAEYIHLSEPAARNSNAQQAVGVYGCFFENIADCTAKVNNINNVEYTKLQNGEISVANLYISFSLPDVIVKNILTYFCSGILMVWALFFIAGRKDAK